MGRMIREFTTMDAVALRRSDEREIADAILLITRERGESRRIVLAELDALGFDEELAERAVEDFAAAQYATLSAADRESAGYRYWSDEREGARL